MQEITMIAQEAAVIHQAAALITVLWSIQGMFHVWPVDGSRGAAPSQAAVIMWLRAGVCMCVCVHLQKSVCVCVSERESEGEKVC